MRNLATFVALFLFSLPVFAQAQPAANVKVKITGLTETLHLLQGRGGNVVASVGDDGILLVDNDFAPLAPAYQQALDSLSGAANVPRFVLNTHWHGDHAGANQHWGEAGAVLVAHGNVRKRMSRPSLHPVTGANTPASSPAALPVVTYADALTLHINGDDVELQHLPGGHTDGDSVVFFVEQNVVHMGDLFFNDAFPFVDTSSGGSLDGYLANVENVLAKIDDKTVIVPGHGPLASKDDLARYADMIRATRAEVEAALATGKSVPAIITAGLTPRWKPWGQGFIKEAQWIATIAAAQ